MKLFKEDSRDRITREIEVLQALRSGANMIEMVDVVQGEEVCLFIYLSSN